MERYKLRCWRGNPYGKGTVSIWTDEIFAEDPGEAYEKLCPPSGFYKIEICLLEYDTDGSDTWTIVDVRYPS